MPKRRFGSVSEEEGSKSESSDGKIHSEKFEDSSVVTTIGKPQIEIVKKEKIPPVKTTSKLSKRENYLSWDDYFMSVAFLSAMRSKDPNTQVGAVIVNSSKRIVRTHFMH